LSMPLCEDGSRESIAGCLRKTAKAHGDAVAIVDGDQVISYRELIRRKDSFSAFLAQQCRLSEGGIAAVSLPNCWQFAAAFFATAELGAICLPVNTQWSEREIGWLSGRLPISVVVTDRERRAPWERLSLRLTLVDELCEAAHCANAGCAGVARGDRAALYLTTSGSTGRPRIVPRSHGNLVAGSTNVARTLGIQPGLRFLSVAPFFHAYGFNNCLFLPLISGCTAVMMRGFTPAALAETVRRYRVQVLIGSPFIFAMLAEHEWDANTFSSVSVCLSSGGPMPPGLAETCRNRLGFRVRQVYGLSETGTISIEPAAGEQVEGSAGKPIRGVEVRISGDDGGDLIRNETGEILVKSPAVMTGYVGDPERNLEVFRDGFFRTGDRGKWDDDGNLILLGRSGRVINIAGVKVDPVEIENVLKSMPGVQNCLVTAARSSRRMEMIKVTITTCPGIVLSRTDIVRHCREYLAEYKIPRVIEFASTAPAEITGKQPVPWSQTDNEFSDS